MSSSTETPNGPVFLTPEEVVRQLRALREQIPAPNPANAAPKMRRRLGHVNADFVHAAINAAGASEVVQKALGRTDDELRAEIDVATRWTAVADELRALLQFVVLGNVARRQRIGLAALQTYSIYRQLARDETAQARLGAHIAEMKRLNTFGRTRRKAGPPDLETQSKR